MDDEIIQPRIGGHIDSPAGFIDAIIGVSVSRSVTDEGEVVMLHLDVVRGRDVTAPFSVGIPLTARDAARVTLAMCAVGHSPALHRAERGNGLN